MNMNLGMQTVFGMGTSKAVLVISRDDIKHPEKMIECLEAFDIKWGGMLDGLCVYIPDHARGHAADTLSNRLLTVQYALDKATTLGALQQG